MPEIKLGNRTYPYSIRQSKRAKYLHLKINARHGLHIVIPASIRPESVNVELMLRDRADWIAQHYDRIVAQNHVRERTYSSGDTMLYMGQSYVLDIQPKANGSRSIVRLDGDSLVIRLDPHLKQGEPRDAVKNALESWYRREARAYLERRVAELAHKHGFTYEKIGVRHQKTRWGSCSGKGSLNFNLRLMMAPPEAIDYIIIHELCHLHEMNHSPKFWRHVARYCPDYKYWRKWFRENGQCLQI